MEVVGVFDVDANGRITDREAVLHLLQQDGPMMLAADDRTVPGKVTARYTTMGDGSSALLGFTSAPEVVAYNPSDAVAALTAGEVPDKVRRSGFGGIVVNPAGPSIAAPAFKIGPHE